jgi:uncharacterized protein
MQAAFIPLAKTADLLPGELYAHRQRNYRYLMELTTDNLLMPYRHEAGLFRANYRLTDCHWGWDGPLSDLRGQFTGHWLSAAARMIQTTGDVPLRQKAEYIVSEIAICQKENGGEWAFPIPEKHLLWLKRGKHTWAPQYVCHKCMMGLLDMHRCAGSKQALDILLKEAEWFIRFTDDISRESMNDMMDWEETGGMMEYWADLFAVTNDARHLEMMHRYERPRLFDALLKGEDILTNMHANTTIPEVHGAARAYEVTGLEKYRRIVENYWDLAVEKRGIYATGGQTSGELWTPMHQQKARLGDKNQEHCVVYNMMRLAEYLLRWTRKSKYADYYERNLWNGLLSQAYWEEDINLDIHCEMHKRETGLVTYYQGLAAGSQKFWGSKTEHFWCCHDTMVQANAMLHEGDFFLDGSGLVICQYHAEKCNFTYNGTECHVTVLPLPRTGGNICYDPIQRDVQSRPEDLLLEIRISCGKPVEMTIRIRAPWWAGGLCKLSVNCAEIAVTVDTDGFIALQGIFSEDKITVCLPKGITCHPLPDQLDTVAFLDGPVVLAGLCNDERTLYGRRDDPMTILEPANERQWQQWLPNWKTRGQPVNIHFIPLYRVGNEKYTVYFPIHECEPKAENITDRH